MHGPAPLTAQPWTPVRIGVAIAALGLAARLPLALLAPVVSPDGERYMRVAANLAQHACISISDPAGGACVPHWGGNHLPGYPAFVALVWLLSGASVTAVTVAQSLLCATAAARLAYAVARTHPQPAVAIAAGVLAALSPLQVPWARFVLPDALTVAAAWWLFAELLLSLHEGRLRIVGPGLAVLASALLRLDGFLLAIPAAVVGVHLHGLLAAVRRGVAVALIVALPIGAILARNVAQGLSLIPQPGMHDGSLPPQGYLAWGNTWITTIYQGGQMAYPMWQYRYGDIVIDESAYSSEDERTRVEELLARLRQAEGQRFPPELDQAFDELAAEKRRQDPLNHYAVVPLRRMANFWFHPFASFGWPLELGETLGDAQGVDIVSLPSDHWLNVLLRHPLEAAGKGALLAYRLLLFGAFVAFVLLEWRRLSAHQRAFVVALALFAFARTAALSYQTSIDNRYMIPAMAAVELLVAMLAGLWFAKRGAG